MNITTTDTGISITDFQPTQRYEVTVSTELTRTLRLPVESLADAATIVKAWIDLHDVPADLWTGGEVYEHQTSHVAHITYDGRICSPDGKREIDDIDMIDQSYLAPAKGICLHCNGRGIDPHGEGVQTCPHCINGRAIN